jgi:hypothetical protein
MRLDAMSQIQYSLQLIPMDKGGNRVRLRERLATKRLVFILKYALSHIHLMLGFTQELPPLK